MTPSSTYSFVIELSIGLRELLKSFITELKQKPWGHFVHWVPHDHLHLTLHFLGLAEEGELPHLLEQAQQAIKDIPCFSLQFDSVRLFPTSNAPRSLGVHLQATSELFELAYTLTEVATNAGFTPETKPYLPHRP